MLAAYCVVMLLHENGAVNLLSRIVFYEKKQNRCVLLLGIKRSQNCIKLCYKGINLKSMHVRVMVLIHDTLSECALQIYEVSFNYL